MLYDLFGDETEDTDGSGFESVDAPVAAFDNLYPVFQSDATRKYVEAGKDLEGKGFDPRKLLAPGAEAIKATVKEKMELFGSVGKA